MSDRTDIGLVHTLNPRNRGLRYVKHLELNCDPDQHQSQLDMTFSLMIGKTPRDNLRSVCWNNWRGISYENVKRLLSTQTRLVATQGIPTNAVACCRIESLLACKASSLSCVEELVLLIDSETSFKVSTWFLVHIRPLRSSTVRVSRGMRKLDFIHTDSQATPPQTVPQAFVQQLLGNYLMVQAEPRLRTDLTKLTTLTLSNVNLASSFEVWSGLVHFERLQTLQLRNCSSSATFLDGLSALSVKSLRRL